MWPLICPNLPHSGCRKRRSAKEFDRFLFCLVTFSDASVTFFVTFLPDSFRRTPFAAGWPTYPVLRGRLGNLRAAFLFWKMQLLNRRNICFHGFRGPAAILFISRDTYSDSITKLFHVCFDRVSRKYRAICCRTEYRTDVPV